MTSASYNAASGYLGSGYCGGNSIPVSGITEKEIVFGGIDRLDEQIKNTVDIINADLFVVISGCTAEIIGDDVISVVKEYNANRKDLPPVIFASGAGFKGNSYWGYDNVLQSLFSNYVKKTTAKRKGLVNIWGIPPGQDVFWEGNLVEIRRLLEGLGLTVNSFFTPSDSLDSIRSSAEAELNIVLSLVNGIDAARTFEKEHGVPFISTTLPIGAKATQSFLSEVASKLGIDTNVAQKAISKETSDYYHYFNRLVDAYSDIDLQRYTVIIGDSNYALALTSFAQNELGWIPGLVIVTDQLEDRLIDRIQKEFTSIIPDAKEKLVFESDTSRVTKAFTERWPWSDGSRYHRAFSPAFVLGSRLDKEFADIIGAGHLSVSYPVSNRVVLNKGYAGFTGGLHLTEDIYSNILSLR
jgi:nitrogenase molybdenum-iron protein beta chain